MQRFHSFIWASGGCFNDFYIHLIDQLGWMKNEWPIKAQALGGRQYRSSPEGITYVDQNFDTYSVEYTYSDGTKFFFDGRTIPGCEQIYSSYLHGTKGSGIASKAGRLRAAVKPVCKPEPDREYVLGIQGEAGGAGPLSERVE